MSTGLTVTALVLYLPVGVLLALKLTPRLWTWARKWERNEAEARRSVLFLSWLTIAGWPLMMLIFGGIAGCCALDEHISASDPLRPGDTVTQLDRRRDRKAR